MSTPKKQRIRSNDQWLGPSSPDDHLSTPRKKGRPAAPAPVTTPSRSSRSQGLVNHVQHGAFRRGDDGHVFSVGDQVLVSASSAPSGRTWLHQRSLATSKRPPTTYRREQDLYADDQDDDEDDDAWTHVDGLGHNEKVAIITALWEDELGEKWAKVWWLARPVMMWGPAGPPRWAPQDWLPYELCYVQDSEWYAIRQRLDAALAKGKALNAAAMTAVELAELSKCTSTLPHTHDEVRTSDIVEPVIVRAFGEDDVDGDTAQDAEGGVKVFRCRRVYDSRPQAWDHNGFVKPLSSFFPNTKSQKASGFDAVLQRGKIDGRWDLELPQRSLEELEREREEAEKKRDQRRQEIMARNKRKREEERLARLRRGEEESEEEVVVAAPRSGKVVMMDEDGESESESESGTEEEEQENYVDAEDEEDDDDEQEDFDDSSDEDFGRSPRKAGTSPRKRGRGSPKKKRQSVRTTASQRAQKASIQARKRANLARRAGLPRSLAVGATAALAGSDDPALQDPFARARMMLHVSKTPDELPCREQEFLDVEANLEEAVEEGQGSVIYISGLPGTGKTATVHCVVRNLRQRVREGVSWPNSSARRIEEADRQEQELKRFRYFEINGMKITEPNQCYVLLWEYLSGGERCSPRQAQSHLDEYFNTPSASRETCVVLVDELDQLVQKNTKNEVIYNLFNWPGLAHSRLIVLAVANKMDMPETELSGKINSRLGSNRITFRPYTAEALETIVNCRLEQVPGVFNPEAVRLVSKKVASVAGDARKALDICRRTAEMVEARNHARKARGEPPVLVQPADIQMTHMAMVASGKAAAIVNMSLHQQAVLVAISKVSQVKGVPEVEISEVIHRHATLTTQTLGLPALSHDDVFDILASLQAMRLVSSEDSRLDYFARVRTDLNPDDLKLIMNHESRFGRVLEAGS